MQRAGQKRLPRIMDRVTQAVNEELSRAVMEGQQISELFEIAHDAPEIGTGDDMITQMILNMFCERLPEDSRSLYILRSGPAITTESACSASQTADVGIIAPVSGA